LALVDLSKDALEQAARSINAEDILLLSADVSKEQDVKNYVEDTKNAFGQIDVFINNAGINGDFANLDEQTEKNFNAVFGVNVL
ncbi:oxidoreductase, partial [Pseudomonas sp. MPR-R5A]